MPAALLDPSTMTPAARDELDAALAGPKILAEPESGFGAGWMVLAALGIGVVAASFGWLGLGVVDSPWSRQGAWILAPYGLGFALTAFGAFKAVVALRRARLPWPTGRFLTTHGFLDTRARPLRVRSIADFTKTEVRRSEGDSGLALYTIDVWFGDEVESFHLFGTERNVPHAALATLAGARDAHVENQRSEGGYRSGAEADGAREAGARATPSATRGAQPRGRVGDHPGKLAIALGVALLVPLRYAVLPWASLRAAHRRGTVTALRAVAAAYPEGWIAADVRPAVHRRYEDARAAVRAKMAPEPAERFVRLLGWLEEHERSTVLLRLEAPSSERIAAATTALEAAAALYPGSRAAPVVLHHQVVGLAGIVVGQTELAGGLARALAGVVPPDVLQLEAEPDPLRAEEARTRPVEALPRIVVASSIATTSVFRGEGSALFAALDFTYETALELPGATREPLVASVTVEPPNDLSVSRLQIGKDKPAPLGGSGDALIDRMEGSMVYTKQASMAAERAAGLVTARLFAR